MDTIRNNVFDSLKFYFNALSIFGYKNQNNVDKLLVYNFIEELLTGEMRYFITEDDYRIIETALSCLYGSSCLIPYPRYINNDTLFDARYKEEIIVPLITEDSNIRVLNDDRIRFKTSN